jgi:hypothetical protein
LKKRAVNIAWAAAFFVFGIAAMVTRQGSHILSESTVYRYKIIPGVDARYTGTAAIVEGLIFVGAGVFFVYRAWAARDDNQGSDPD